MTQRTMKAAAALAALALMIGCGDSGGGGSSSAAPSAAEAETVQKSDGAGEAASQTMKAATDAILDDGTGGQVTAKGNDAAARSTSGSFSFQANVNVTIDLDATDGAGADLYPNATGQLNVVAAGTIAGNSTSGTATYDVETTWLTAGVFTDPVSGVVATMAAGSGIDYSLSVSWNATAPDNWSISATTDFVGEHTLTVTDGAATTVITSSGSRHEEASITRTPGSFSIVVSVTGSWTVTVTDGTELHTVTVAVAGLDHITITVDGTTYGPYTAYQIRQHFGCVID